jgi:hypothetical protein
MSRRHFAFRFDRGPQTPASCRPLALVAFHSWLACLPTLAAATAAAAEFDPQPHLERPVIGADQSLDEVQAYCAARVPPIPEFETVDQWRQFADKTRRRVLDEVVFRGEAARWRKAACKVEWLETIDGDADYRIRKVRYEALPGMWIPALLYEPKKLADKAPVFLNVNGHDRVGKAADYKQILCINQAKQGFLVLNVEWFGMGQLNGAGYSHARMNQLDMCGGAGIAPFLLAVQRGFDLLLAHPNADPARVGVAGASGGGWQTIFVAALDPRVTFCNPVAGYSSFVTRAEFHTDLGDSEQTPVDLGVKGDYALLTAMLAPRPALLTFNAKDNCCFAADHALPPLLDAARPIYRLFGKENDLRWQVNHVPGDHNFGQENREALYRTVGDAFFPGDEKYERHEIPCESQVKKPDELAVDLPAANEDFHTLALKLAEGLPRHAEVPDASAARQTWTDEARRRLEVVVRAPRYEAKLDAEPARTVDGIAVRDCRFRIGADWTVPGVEFSPADAKETVLVMTDAGRKTAADEVRRHLAAGRRVIAIDPFYWGESSIKNRNFLWALMISTVGDRPLGVQAAQLAAIARALESEHGGKPSVVARGPRASLAGLVAAGLEPNAFAKLETVDCLSTLKQVLTDDRQFSEAPEYFCFGLLEQFDIPQLIALAGADRVESRKP